MLQALEIIFNGVWDILSNTIPVSSTISFTLWQYFLFILIVIVLIRQLFGRGGE
ncbi:hypothetical protein Dhaf_2705 [Desulfitobacterium hafniense DCB-2]|uniref:Uncharacterized protein n=1 Tax=Desulfitobacterium hafniense (strain DSM 10664 / DCB-2) TaxID=272564 RepID=B8FWB9_DESHD|nr:hypothetical protein Dhaf_2705 [Desulfitobacterium hafniense DCB-2]